ncbi:MAG: nucleoside hydrolase [Actinobacteria bacterium]|nr:nucleoside hydrolase [Actinomycetota bacterium]
MRCPLPLVIDTDGGTDDAVAIWWALTEPGVELVALIATGGNVSRDIAATNCNRILTAAGRLGIPIALGAEGPMGGRLSSWCRRCHSRRRRAGRPRRIEAGGRRRSRRGAATIFLSRLMADQLGELALATIGPVSTLAGALRTDPALASRVGALAVRVGGR